VPIGRDIVRAGFAAARRRQVGDDQFDEIVVGEIGAASDFIVKLRGGGDAEKLSAALRAG
jgi:hypothetical protein